ncbi:MAG: endonuclease domain-containing protein [Bacteroidota bacterium]|nr:endonuclease domain-containing protein [Bacteroidota bacterium]
MTDPHNDNLHKGAIGKLYQYGRELRQSSTKAETILWEYLRNRKLEGLKFRRQHPIDKFVADFYCHEKKLVVELDGAVHDDKMNAQYDEARTYELKGSGIKVIRFRNSEVENNISFVLNEIGKATEN